MILPYLGVAIRTELRLSGRAEISVSVGQRVDLDTVVGYEDVPVEPVIVDVAGALRQSPSSGVAVVPTRVRRATCSRVVAARLRECAA
ncbi:MAG: hypothetical protein WKH64_05475 [Chloroflexia bacterium]